MGVETLIQVTVDKYLWKCVNNYEKLLGFFFSHASRKRSLEQHSLKVVLGKVENNKIGKISECFIQSTA